MPNRAVFFVDGNNWYHSLKENDVRNLGLLDYKKIFSKLVGPRDWIASHYYIGRVNQEQNQTLYAQQRRFTENLRRDDSRIATHFGRLEPRERDNPAASELGQYLAKLSVRIDPQVYRDLIELAQRHKRVEVFVEKAVDVKLAVDLVLQAERDEYDTAYILSADGDYTSAVEAVTSKGKRVYAASMSNGAQLARVVDSYIRLKKDWFFDCYR